MAGSPGDELRAPGAATRQLPVFPLAPAPVGADRPAGVATLLDPQGSVGSSTGPRVSLVTLGCDKNTVDSERIMAALVAQGAQVSPDVDGAEVVIVNTCGFIQAAKEQSIQTLLEAHALREEGRGPAAVVAVGCLVERYKDELQAEMPEVDLFLGLNELDRLVPGLQEQGLLAVPEESDAPGLLMERPLRVLSTTTPHTSFLKISEGCDHTCAFCAIPSMRGLHRSQPLEALVAEADALGRAGVRELNVISQDTTWYGRDLRRRDGPTAPLLPDLIRALLDGTDVEWYRLFYMYPSGITDALIHLIATEDRVLPYLDMPLQHGSDAVLTRMRRPERRDTIRERVTRLREAVPDLTLRTTVIVGFPGESDDDFEQLLDLLEELRFDRVGAFAYSEEEGTRAATMDGQVPDSLKRERLDRVLDVQASVAFERNQRWVGRTVDVLVDEAVPNDADHAWVGHAANQAVDVDGVTYLVHGSPDVAPGDRVRVRIEDASEHDLVGRVEAAVPRP